MRAWVPRCVLTVAVLFPNVGNAQVYQFRTPPPQVNAAAASWQVSSEPIIFNSLSYYPTREYRMFDGQVMAQVGVFAGVPVYADTTLEPHSILYVPVGVQRMRGYERLRDRELAGTTGSRPPTFAVTPQAPPAPQAPPREERVVGTSGTLVREDGVVGTARTRVREEGAVGTAGSIVPSPARESASIPERTRPTRTRIEMIPPPPRATTSGVWLEFKGARWYSAGSAVPFMPDRFTPVGEYRGFPVYRANSGDPDRIWVSVVQDGPLAPYEKR